MSPEYHSKVLLPVFHYLGQLHIVWLCKRQKIEICSVLKLCFSYPVRWVCPTGVHISVSVPVCGLTLHYAVSVEQHTTACLPLSFSSCLPIPPKERGICVCVRKEAVMIICCQSKVFANERGAEVRRAQGHICIKLMIACKWTKFLSEERGIHPLGAPSCWWSAESHYWSNTITAVSIRRGDRETRLALLLYYVLCGMAQSGQLH